MKQRAMKIVAPLLGVAISLVFTVISANADVLKPYVTLAWIGLGIVVVVMVFFNVTDGIKLPSFHLLFFPRKRLSTLQTCYTDAETELVKHPDLEEVDDDKYSKLFSGWEKTGKDLMVMSILYPNARKLMVDWTTLIALALLRRRQKKSLNNFIHLGSTAYKRAKHLKRWDAATRIAYYMAHTYYRLEGNLRMNDGHKWVNRMQDIYNKYSTTSSTSHDELGLLLLEVQGLLFKEDTQKRDDAKTNFNHILARVQVSPLSHKPHVARMMQNVYFHLGNLAELETDNKAALAWYEKALNITSKDSSDQIYIYNKLGEIALRERDYQEACKYYTNQLGLVKKLEKMLAKEKSILLWQSDAYKGLITAFFAETPLNIKEAYLHAQQWLKIVKMRSKDNLAKEGKEEEYKVQTIVIQIADNMYETYIGPLPSAN